jgi:hypothetical protein
MIVRKYQFIALAFLGFSLSLLLSCASPSTGVQSYAMVAPPALGMARVWFLRTRDPQEQFGDPIIFANGNQIGRSVPGIAFYHDFPPGTYAFTVQSYGLTAGQPTGRDRVQLAPGTDTYLEILWGGSWLEGVPGGCHLFCANIAAGSGAGLSACLHRSRPASGVIAASTNPPCSSSL